MKNQNKNLSIKQRINEPTPNFFKKLRNIGLGIAAVAGTILASPVTLPSLIVTIAGYALVAGTVISAVSQVATKEDEKTLVIGK